MKLWVDRNIPPPDEEHIWSRNLVDAREALTSGTLASVSIAGEMAVELAQHMDVLVSEGLLQRIGVRMHTPEPHARERLRATMELAMKYWAEEERHSVSPHCPPCPLIENCRMVRGEGECENGIMFVGEAPGAHEEEEGRPFVGSAGKTLRRLITDSGLETCECRITNVIKCRPPENRRPTKNEITACSAYLRAEYVHYKPRVIVAVGLSAAQALTNTDRSMASLIEDHDHLAYHCAPVIPVYHTSRLCINRTKGAEQQILDGIAEAKAIVGIGR